MSRNFALLGVGGFVAPRHLQAIADTKNRLIAACDPNDSVGILDRHFPNAAFFTEFERFDRFLEKQRRRGADERVHFVSVCSPNYLHDAHVRLALRLGADAICEKPLVINPWNLDQLSALEEETGRAVYTVLQLRLLPAMQQLKAELATAKRHAVDLSYVTRRGAWYHASWKGDEHKSGGLSMNIGIHLFDLMTWLFGPAKRVHVHRRDHDRVAGFLELQNADVRFLLSVNYEDLPQATRDAGKTAFRSLAIDGAEVEFSEGFTDLHSRVYESILNGNGFRIETARPSIELAYQVRTASLETGGTQHPALRQLAREHG